MVAQSIDELLRIGLGDDPATLSVTSEKVRMRHIAAAQVLATRLVAQAIEVQTQAIRRQQEPPERRSIDVSVNGI